MTPRYFTLIPLNATSPMFAQFGWDGCPTTALLELCDDGFFIRGISATGVEYEQPMVADYVKNGDIMLPRNMVFDDQHTDFTADCWQVIGDGRSVDVWRAQVNRGRTMLGYGQWRDARRDGHAGWTPPAPTGDPQ